MKKSGVYTKTGDKGTTSLVGGTRVAKSNIRLDAYGTVDELNSFVGFLACSIKDENTLKILSFIQYHLFTVGSYLATETESIAPNAASIIGDDDIKILEDQMDQMDSTLPKIKYFILPGGSESSSRAHLCRTIARRAERCTYRVKEEYPVEENVLVFVNRLSDYFFILARFEANKDGGKEIFWNKPCF